mgnify:CR=1 FL=1
MMMMRWSVLLLPALLSVAAACEYTFSMRCGSGWTWTWNKLSL